MKTNLLWLMLGFLSMAVAQQPANTNSADDKPRVFVTDSQSWEMMGAAGGSGGSFGAESHGGARPQTAEIIKTFGEKCPEVTVNNRREKASYIVVLDHEGGKGVLRHKNKVAVFESDSGDSIVSKSTMSLGGSVDEACRAIKNHWATHKHDHAGPASASDPQPGVVPVSTASVSTNTAEQRVSKSHLTVVSIPDGADIEIDGNFMGNTPSSLDLAPGNYTVSVKKSGYKPWERKMKVSGGEVSLKAELEKLP